VHELAELGLRHPIHARHLPLPVKTTICGQTVAQPTVGSIPGQSRPTTERVVRTERPFAVLSARRPIGADRGRRAGSRWPSFGIMAKGRPKHF
jgi:hypothetical protein